MKVNITTLTVIDNWIPLSKIIPKLDIAIDVSIFKLIFLINSYIRRSLLTIKMKFIFSKINGKDFKNLKKNENRYFF